MSDKAANEIWLGQATRIGSALTYAYNVLEKDGKFDHIFIKGVGSAIPNVVALAELLRHKVKGLH